MLKLVNLCFAYSFPEDFPVIFLHVKVIVKSEKNTD